VAAATEEETVTEEEPELLRMASVFFTEASPIVVRIASVPLKPPLNVTVTDPAVISVVLSLFEKTAPFQLDPA